MEQQGLIEFVDTEEVKIPVNTVFAYEGANVTFARKGGVVMVNATEMAKKFGKKSTDWTKTESSKRFMKALSEVKNINSSDLVQVTYGNNGGTWMHEDVAIEFGESRKTMSSVEIAEIVGKPHNDVLKAIRKMEPAWEKVHEGKFSRSEYKDSTGRSLPCFELTSGKTKRADHLHRQPAHTLKFRQRWLVHYLTSLIQTCFSCYF